VPYRLDDKLVVGITSRALFDLDEANDVFTRDGLTAYRTHQRANEDNPLNPGTGLPLVRGLLAINALGKGRRVEVIVISRNDADSGVRIFNSIEHHKLDITRGAFTDGRDASAYLEAFDCDLFLSAESSDVRHALERHFPAALVLAPPATDESIAAREVRIAFDGDAVLFDEESERVFQEQGMAAFLERESKLATEPMNPGPFKPFLMGVKLIQDLFAEESSPIRTALVTSRNAPAHKRVVNTLRAWGVRIDETFFLGGIEKARILHVFRPHIFFDDQLAHLEGARAETPSAHVPSVGAQIPLPFVAESSLVSVEPVMAREDGSRQEEALPHFADGVIARARRRRKRRPTTSNVRSDGTARRGLSAGGA
jgi:5'-nucleotidase